ncbi:MULTISPECIES: flagellar motor stator protein MotA [Idiomarinaceae]|uniref:Flagellar motor stator protein MotA n=1 Tax=Pseudidiomarina fusca TaxID=2965078 RepID=A0ABU3KW62_9GAMM|nr:MULTISPECIES: flagellar motor stator protein MotA [Idiomarinaceae]MDX1526718.1 flagellar motor stator protein MotA [Pseudidiomarina maritima]NCU57045.1 flagellar motor stator protein MotA [Idiomarina sp. FenA--70]NCU59754.1 flagellar motor stator protein MotA [Idiomarina sp. FenBw--71]MDT7525729.1 flagellar motor stator protein MotA [Pseudidiomarina sp. GXY010]MRJ42120.1 flagellar motor stator protein MotA [Idiomarina sp. FeN1]
MLVPLGFIIVIASVFGGYALAGGSLGPLFQPLEFVIIGGAGLGAFIAANNGKAIKATLKMAKRVKPSTKYTNETYLELLAVIYKLLNKMRRDGMLAVERDIENPTESAIFSEHPDVLEDEMMLNFISDYLRLMISGNMNPQELDELMLHEIETFEAEGEIPADALSKVGDAMPAFGIVAAVLGVVRALSTADVPPDVMGNMIAHALVGTFLGILLGYGFINPLASRVERQVQEMSKTLQVIRVTLLASMHGYAPQLAVEFGRKALFSEERPSFNELEDYVRGAKSDAS